MNTGLFPATAMPDPDWWQGLWPRPGEVLAKLGIQPGTDAVDLYCGDGLFTVPLAAVARRIVAIDLDPEMLELARARAATPELPQAFGAWLKDLEGKAEAPVSEGEKDAAALATMLGIDEDSARYVIGRLAASGKVTLVARPRG